MSTSPHTCLAKKGKGRGTTDGQEVNKKIATSQQREMANFRATQADGLQKPIVNKVSQR